MKRFVLKLLSIILIFSMLIPTLISCKDDPPPDDDDDENGGKEVQTGYIDATLTGMSQVVILDLNNSANSSVAANKNYLDHVDGSLTDADGNTVSYQKATHSPYATVNGASTTDTNDFLEITINHGTGDGSLDGKYAYLYMPEATVEETEAYYSAPNVALLSYTTTTFTRCLKRT